MRLPDKDPAEVRLLRFVFERDIEPGQTIAAVDVTIALAKGGPDPDVAAVLDGAAVIDNASLCVLQRVRAGVVGAEYQIRCLVTDSSGLKPLISATLPVRTIL